MYNLCYKQNEFYLQHNINFKFAQFSKFIFPRKEAELQMDGQFLVRQIYDDELTYNLISAAVNLLRKFSNFSFGWINLQP